MLTGEIVFSITGSSCSPVSTVKVDLLCHHPNCCSCLDCCSYQNYPSCKVVGRQFDPDSYCHRQHCSYMAQPAATVIECCLGRSMGVVMIRHSPKKVEVTCSSSATVFEVCWSRMELD